MSPLHTYTTTCCALLLETRYHYPIGAGSHHHIAPTLQGITSMHDCFQVEQSESLINMQAALEAVTATHQLESAMDVFSWCVRPLLRQGYLQPLTQDIGADRVSALRVHIPLIFWQHHACND